VGIKKEGKGTKYLCGLGKQEGAEKQEKKETGRILCTSTWVIQKRKGGGYGRKEKKKKSEGPSNMVLWSGKRFARE